MQYVEYGMRIMTETAMKVVEDVFIEIVY